MKCGNRPSGRGVVSRRDLLRATAAGGLGISLGTWPVAFGGAMAAEAPGFGVASTTFSAAERDRRWAAVRGIMARPPWNLDAIVAVDSDRGDYARYLTQIGNRPGSGAAPEVIFPRDRARPVHVQLDTGRAREVWQARLRDWSADGQLVIDAKSGPEAMAERIKAYGLDRAGTRIGVARLSGSRFESNGLVSATYLDALKAALPGVSFVAIDQWGADSGPVEESAMLKGAEEHAVVRRAIAASERGLAAMVAALRGGARRQADAWFAGYTAMFAATGEDPTRLSIALDRPANSTLGEPVTDAVREGQIVNEEIDATVQGYRAQVNHAVFVGGRSTPGYDYYRTAMEGAIAIVDDCTRSIVPGKTTCGELVNRYLRKLAEIGGEDTAGVILHSSGIGNLTRPRLGPGNSAKDFGIVIRPGMTFDFKPQFHLKRERIADVGARNRDVQIGEHFLVTASGVERLGTRELAPLTTS